MSRLKELYQKEIIPGLKKEFGFKNNLEVPRISKIIVNVGVGKTLGNSKLLDDTIKDLAKITGQRPVKTKAKKSIAGFKLREGAEIGAKITLRGKRMYEFLDRLVNIALPRVRDFRGISKNAFDGQGNYTLGIKEHTIFPEVSHEEVSSAFGLEVNIITTTSNDEKAFRLLSMFGFPFKEK